MAKATESVSIDQSAWTVFETRLADALGALTDDQFLVLSAKTKPIYVQFVCQGSFGFRVETVSNKFLRGNDRLTAEQQALNHSLGWSEPGTHSPNYYLDAPKSLPPADVARMAVRTLVETWHLHHPGLLSYQAFDKNSHTILLPTLGVMHQPATIKVAPPAAATPDQVRARVLDALRSATEIDDLEFDPETKGLQIRFGTALLTVEVREAPLRVTLTSPLVSQLENQAGLLARINDVNARLTFARVLVVDDTIFATVDVLAVPFVADHVAHACNLLGALADEFDGLFQQEFGGRTAFGEFRSKGTVH
jgi:hypothetical protein